jgi:hypothetical protein
MVVLVKHFIFCSFLQLLYVSITLAGRPSGKSAASIRSKLLRFLKLVRSRSYSQQTFSELSLIKLDLPEGLFNPFPVFYSGGFD